jgi:hypothetical protein
VDLVFLDSDYEKTLMHIEGQKIEKGKYLKYLILKHIPILSFFNFVSVVFSKNGLSALELKMKIQYFKTIEKGFLSDILKKMFRILLIFSLIQFIGCSIVTIKDPSRRLMKEINELEVVKNTSTNLIVDNKSNNLIYHVVVYLEDGYIHYNKLTYAKKTSKDLLERMAPEIYESVKKKSGEISSYNLVFYNDYTKTWDKFMFDKTFERVYEMPNISSDINDIDIYIQNNTLVYNLLTNISKEDIGWDIAEFMLSEFEEDIENIEINNIIKEIVSSDEEINKYVVNILSKEYYTSSENAYFIYIKHLDDEKWYYYDNRFYTLENKERIFESTLREHIKEEFDVDFTNIYENGELLVTLNNPKISENEYNEIYNIIIDILNNSSGGISLREQVKYIGKSADIDITLKIKEDIYEK